MRQGDAGVAHPVERHLAKVEVASSSLVTRSIKPIQTDGFSFCSEVLSPMKTVQNILIQVVAMAIMPFALIGALFQKNA